MVTEHSRNTTAAASTEDGGGGATEDDGVHWPEWEGAAGVEARVFPPHMTGSNLGIGVMDGRWEAD
jgi:hypothetical protein